MEIMLHASVATTLAWNRGDKRRDLTTPTRAGRICVTGETATRRDEAISLSGRSQIKRRPGYKWHVFLLLP